MSDENVRTTSTAYPKTGLFVAATVLPLLGWAGRQLYRGAQNALDGKSNDPVIEDED